MTQRKVSLLLAKYCAGRANPPEKIEVFRLLLEGSLSENQRLAVFQRLADERTEFTRTETLGLLRWLNHLHDALVAAGFQQMESNEVVNTLRVATPDPDAGRMDVTQLTLMLDIIVSRRIASKTEPAPHTSLIVKLAITLRSNLKTTIGLTSLAAGLFVVIWTKMPHTTPPAEKAACPENSVSAHGKGFVTLPDKTEVILGADSKICYPKPFYSANGRREIGLESGTIYLEVAPDKSRPLFVYAPGSVTAEVRGTGLNIEHDLEQQTVKVSLVHGEVIVHHNGERIAVSPNQVLTVMYKTGETRAEEFNPTDVAWPYPKIDLENATLEKFAQVVYKRFHIEVVFENAELKKCTINGFFEGDRTRLSHLIYCMEASSDTFALKFVNNKLVISGTSCWDPKRSSINLRQKKVK